MNNIYRVRKWETKKEISVQVPGSKSITNRALLLAALSGKECTLRGVLFSEDSRAFLNCLKELGFSVNSDEKARTAVIQGMGGSIPNKRASIHVGSAGTAARFLTVMLAFAGGDYFLDASEQMRKRPMKPLLDALEKTGVIITYDGEEGHFPFHLRSENLSVKELTIDTDISSQFASALLMSGGQAEGGLRVTLSGSRTEGSYIKMTTEMMRQFGMEFQKEKDSYQLHKTDFGVEEYQIEPDVSAACYFYAMAPLLKTDVVVRGVHGASLQGDIKFLQVLEELGCVREEEEAGIRLKGSKVAGYQGLTVDMKDFSDQTMAMAAIAPFAKTPTLIKNIGHIRYQESDRIRAILTELARMGISCKEAPEDEGIYIEPGEIRNAEIETYEDHRMAMAFTLIGLKTGKIAIKNPSCCAKTFENYFDVIEELYGERK